MHRLSKFHQAIWPSRDRVPSREVRCSGCGLKNRVGVPLAMQVPDKHECGECGQKLFLGVDEGLRDLSSAAYQHNLDRRSLEAVKSLPGLPGLVHWILQGVGDRSTRLLFMSDAVLCGDDQFPELVALMDKARARLDLPFRPTMFLGESPHMNAMTTGVDDTVIVVRSALLDQMSDAELVAVLGHELGHLHAGHPLYHQVAHLVLQGGQAGFSLVRLLSAPLQSAMLRWSRCAELTCDRAALLATRDLSACIGMMLKFAAGNRPGTKSRTRIELGPFIRQCRELEEMHASSWVDSTLGAYLTMDRTHPQCAWRVMHLINWVENGNYLNILAGEYPRRKSQKTEEPLSTYGRGLN